MNKREIILDFTPLLDVIMILLFMFMLTARNDVSSAKADAEELAEQIILLQTEMELQAEEYELQIEELNELIVQYEQQIGDYEMASDLVNQYVLALHNYEEGRYVRFRLKDVVSDNNWQLEISYGDDSILIAKDDRVKMREKINKFLSVVGFRPSSIVICQFEYDGDAPGTKSAYDDVESILQSLKTDYKKFSLQIVDISRE